MEWVRLAICPVSPLPPPCTHIPKVILVGKLSLRSHTPVVPYLTGQHLYSPSVIPLQGQQLLLLFVATGDTLFFITAQSM